MRGCAAGFHNTEHRLALPGLLTRLQAPAQTYSVPQTAGVSPGYWPQWRRVQLRDFKEWEWSTQIVRGTSALAQLPGR
jgi:hypothetical protein